MSKRYSLTAGVALLLLGAIYVWLCRAPATPSASVKLVGYETRQDSVVATVLLTNTGSSALSYVHSSQGVYYTVLARVQGQETNLNSGGGPGSMAGDIVVWPSRSERIKVVLPTGTQTWRCTIPVYGTGARIRVFTHLGEWGVWNRTYPVSQWFVRLFPLNDSVARQIQSDTFTIATNTVR